MTKEEKLKIKQECRDYLEELEKDPISGPNCFNADELTLGIMFRVHPSMTYRATEEARKKVMSDKLYPYFKNEVLKIAEEKGWYGIVALYQKKGFLPGNYKGTIKNGGLKQTGGYSKEDYYAAAEEVHRFLENILDNEDIEKKTKGR